MKRTFTLTIEEVALIVHRHLKATDQVLSAELPKGEVLHFCLKNRNAPEARLVKLEIEYDLVPNVGHVRKVQK